MQKKVEVDEAIARGQLLTLVQQQGRAKEALVCFVPLALSLLQRISIQSSTSAVLSLLNAAIERRQSAWTQGLIAERKTKRQRTSDSSQSDVVFSAKLVQNLVKAYAPISVATIKAGEMEDLIAAMDLACVALYVVCALEHTVRLGDLVVDNLLYQVAKKYGEIPKMLEAASCVAACVHARLWIEHTKLCKASGEDGPRKSELMICLQDSSSTDVIAHRVVKKLDILAEFPTPSSCHSAQFTRLLVGYMNICVTLLVAAQKQEAVRLLAEATLSPWIDHLEKTSDQSSKLASSFRDRTFRILWKCATALEKGDQNSSKASSTALLFRSTALTFVLRCSNYTSEYFIQQVHRVAVQHERISKRSPQGLKEVCAFYDRSMDALLQTIPNSAYTSKSLQWEYLQWLEHYAFICETLEMHLESTMILEKALHYVRLFGTTEKPIQSCLRLSIAGALFSASDSTKKQDESSHLRSFGKRLRCEAGRSMADRILCTSPDKLPEECKRIAQVYLEKLDKSIASSFESLGEQDLVKFVPFVIRCVKRSSTKLFNYTISVQHSATCRHVAKSFGEICKALKKLRTSAQVDRNSFETLISEELRLHRMAVVLSVRSCLGDTCNSTPTKPVLEMMSTQLSSVHDLLKDACMGGDKSTKSILQGFRGDLKSVLRECYSCASRCYKVGTYSEVIATLSGACSLAQSYVEYVMSSTASADEKHEVYAQLKVDEMTLLLAHCFREIGNISSSRQFIGHALIYCADIKDNIPYAAIDKYVCCIMDEAKELGDGMQDSVVNTCTSFWDTMHHVLKSRGVSEDQRLLLWRTFRCALNGASEKVVDNVRVEDEGAHSSFGVAESFVNSCGSLQSYLDGILVKDKLKAVNGQASSLEKILSDVSQSLAKRKQLFYHWYRHRDFNAAIKGLTLVHQSLTLAAKTLQSFAGAASVDLGGVLGWCGILVIELTLIVSYAGFPECEVANENITYDNAVADIEQCLKYWTKEDTPGFLFDEPYMVSCLSSICNALSLLSCSSLETAARKLLKKLQQSVNIQEVIAPPRFGLFGLIYYQQNGLDLDKQGFTPSSTDCTVESKLFEQADQALLAAKISSDKGRTCQSMLDVITILGKIKPRMRQCQAVTVAKAIGMREMLVHMILSEFYFHEGRSNCAIKEAKIALSICWKMAKKSTALFASTDAWSFNLPSQLSGKKSRERHSAHVLCFMALS